MSNVVKGVVKTFKPNAYYGIGDGEGKFAFISTDNIENTYPQNPKKWQETLFLVKNLDKVKWKDEDSRYYEKGEYEKNRIPVPKPVPADFMINDDYRELTEGITEKVDSTRIVKELQNIRKVLMIQNKILMKIAGEGMLNKIEEKKPSVSTATDNLEDELPELEF